MQNDPYSELDLRRIAMMKRMSAWLRVCRQHRDVKYIRQLQELQATLMDAHKLFIKERGEVYASLESDLAKIEYFLVREYDQAK